ncbi:DUF1565 domain-containing protein [Frondihabitans sp. PAMC 28766]|uniref:DUF1565 domain-containing protein n=1 Tax=Frondihabitans sp. PAMC 28766 TaxID=1795630 RepID=UPI000A85A0A9|nr:DUF1565 domain-containing protein [Frondihabitans sp. PAMC 28766]
MAPSHALRKRRAFPVVPILGLVVGIVVAGVTSTQVAQAAPSLTASDAFSRTVSNGWGSATKGGAYTVVADKATKLSVSSGRGHIRDLARGRAVTSTLKSVSAGDVEMQGTMVMPGKAPIVYHAYQLRTQTNGSLYRGRLDVLAGGDVDLTVSRLDPGNKEVTLSRKLLSIRAGTNTAITSDFQITGTSPVTIKARAWLAGAAQPSWQLTTTDSSAQRIRAAGHVGLWEYSSGSNRAAIGTDEDAIVVTSNPTTAVVPPTPPVTPPPVTTPPVTVPPVSPPASPPTSSDRGSLPVGSSDYPVPAGAVFVSPTGSDAAAGSETSPLKTLGAAIAKATPGSTIVLRAGVYNESVVIPESKPYLTVEAYPHEAVWLDGSVPVTNWTKTGSTWTSSGWTTSSPTPSTASPTTRTSSTPRTTRSPPRPTWSSPTAPS